MLYTSLGDSITFGQDASSCAKAYPHLVVSALNASSHPVRGYVLACPGWSSSDLLGAVVGDGSSLISHSAVVSVWIGGVDLARAALASFSSRQSFDANRIVTDYRQNVSAILTRIRKCSLARMICCTQYNPFPNSPVAVAGINRLNRATSKLARSYGADVAPVHAWFEGKQAELIHGYRNGKIEDALSGSLPIHPNDRGHRVIAHGLAPYLIPRK